MIWEIRWPGQPRCNDQPVSSHCGQQQTESVIHRDEERDKRKLHEWQVIFLKVNMRRYSTCRWDVANFAWTDAAFCSQVAVARHNPPCTPWVPLPPHSLNCPRHFLMMPQPVWEAEDCRAAQGSYPEEESTRLAGLFLEMFCPLYHQELSRPPSPRYCHCWNCGHIHPWAWILYLDPAGC